MTSPTQKEIAEHLFVSTRRVREMQSEGILPAEVESLDEARRLAFEWLRGRAAGKAPKTHALEDARSEALRIDIEKKRLELAELQGQLVRIDVCREEWRSTCINIRTKLLTAPNKCAALVSPDVAPIVQETVKGVVHETLRELARDDAGGTRAPRARSRSDSRRPRGSRSARAEAAG